LPQAVAENDRVPPLVLRGEIPAEQRLDAEHRQQRSRHHRAEHLVRVGVNAQVEQVGRPERHLIERLVGRVEVAEVRQRPA
jgi:hypothetical protein